MFFFLSQYPDKAHEISCKWNYKYGQCKPVYRECLDAATDGAAIVHGITSSFDDDIENKFLVNYLFSEYLELANKVPNCIY